MRTDSRTTGHAAGAPSRDGLPTFDLPAPSALVERRVGVALWLLLAGVLLALGNA